MKLDEEKVNQHLQEQLNWSEGNKLNQVDEEVEDIIRKSDYSIGIFIGAIVLVVILLVLWFGRDVIWPNRYVP